jgi:hypothetical protein
MFIPCHRNFTVGWFATGGPRQVLVLVETREEMQGVVVRKYSDINIDRDTAACIVLLHCRIAFRYIK